MKKTNKILSVFLALLMVISIIPMSSITASAKNITEYNVGDIIEFGSYPQSRVTNSSLISTLNSKSKSWVSYEYYSGTGKYRDGMMQPSNYMKYADVTYNGNRYRAVLFTEYRPVYTGYTTLADNSNQDENGYYINTVYWFKYEPILWRVLDPDEGLVMCESIIDAQAYNNTIYAGYNYAGEQSCFKNKDSDDYANDYATSSIREWLNDEFYNTAFNSEEKSQIQVSTQDNRCYVYEITDSYSKYDSETTYDKIFLLSYDETKNSEYGFSSIGDAEDFDDARLAKGTEYAKCQGLGCEEYDDPELSKYSNCSTWFLRSPSTIPYNALTVTQAGSFYEAHLHAIQGVRPAIKLQIENSSDIYNLGEETYSFANYTDEDSYGHCFGMSMTSAAYHLNLLDIAEVGGNKEDDVYRLSLNSAVKNLICYYQDAQCKYVRQATVAGGRYYKYLTWDVEADWSEVVNYVKNHNYDNTGLLQIVIYKNYDGISGHAVNFLYYKVVDGQERLYAYDNNYPDIETYFYQGSDGRVYQAPRTAYSNGVDTIQLVSVPRYFEVVEDYDFTRYISAEEGNIEVKGSTKYYEIGGDGNARVIYEIPQGIDKATIIPLEDNASFEYLNYEYSFDEINDLTVGSLNLLSIGDVPTSTTFEILEIGFEIQSPSKTEIRYKDGIVLHSNIEGTAPAGSYVEWSWNNSKFDVEKNSDDTLTIISENNGKTTFIATLYSADGEMLATDTVEMTSKAGFFDKIGGFFRSLFGTTKVYEY